MNEVPAATRGLLLVLSGPAGVGKDTVWKAASTCLPGFTRAVTCTTREQRPGEVNGVHYYFVDDAEFDRLIAADELLEWAWVHNKRYGVPVSSVAGRIEAGADVVCIIEVQGALRIRELFERDAVLVFLKPPAGREAETLKERIQGRGAENDTQIAHRLQTAAWELEQSQFYDHEIVNDEVAHAAHELCDVIRIEKARRGHVPAGE